MPIDNPPNSPPISEERVISALPITEFYAYAIPPNNNQAPYTYDYATKILEFSLKETSSPADTIRLGFDIISFRQFVELNNRLHDRCSNEATQFTDPLSCYRDCGTTKAYFCLYGGPQDSLKYFVPIKNPKLPHPKNVPKEVGTLVSLIANVSHGRIDSLSYIKFWGFEPNLSEPEKARYEREYTCSLGYHLMGCVFPDDQFTAEVPLIIRYLPIPLYCNPD
jgi:hypothetical protein